jgi:tripartite-type tricarboxylate transporter receptor subunit TctC
LFGRLLARHLERAVPGLRLNVQNVGKAGGKLCAKMIQDGPSDGSVIAFPPVSLLTAQFLDEEGIAYDIGTWQWIGKLAAEARLLVKGPGANFTGILDLRGAGQPATLSVRSTSAFAYYEALCVNAMLGTRIKPVPGYKSGEKEAAMLSGEVMLTTGNYPDDLKTLESPGVEAILRINDAAVPSPYDKAPTLAELRGGDQRYALVASFLNANYELGRWVAAPPAIEADVLAEWRTAFDATVVKPEFIEEARRLDIELVTMPGAELQRRIGDILADQGKLRRELNAAFECGRSLAEGVGAACQQA